MKHLVSLFVASSSLLLLLTAAQLQAEPIVYPPFSVDHDSDGIPDAYDKGWIVGLEGVLRVGAPGEVLLQEESMCPENGIVCGEPIPSPAGRGMISIASA